MANICMDTVVFYSEYDLSLDELQQLKKAIEVCYPADRHYSESSITRLFEFLNISTDVLHLRGDVVNYTLEDSFIRIECDSAWMPMKDAYDTLCSHFDLEMVLMAEESGSDIYYNTDEKGYYLSTSYKISLSHKPDDDSLNDIFQATDGDTDFYFDSSSELLQWFHELGHIEASTISELQGLLDSDYITIHKFTNPY